MAILPCGGMAVLPFKSLPVGYRFRPTDEELINHYLRSKINGNEDEVSVIREIDVCKWEPWDLPDMSVVPTNDDEWFFFCPKDRKYQNGQRLNRATISGYWKATGKDRSIRSGRRAIVIGMKKTLVFYIGRAPKGKRTNWVIHEYRATSKELDGSKPGQGSFVLCKLIKKHDEKLEEKQDENTDDIEENVSSPATTKSITEDMPSGPATPLVCAQPVKAVPSSSESGLAENFEKTNSDTPLPNEWTNYSIADDAGNEYVSQPDFELEAMLGMFDDSVLGPSDGDGKIFSPLHKQMQAELGSSYDLHYPLANNMGHDFKAVQHQYGTNEREITDFLDSVFVKSNEPSLENSACYMNSALESESPKYINMFYAKDSGSCSESDQEVAQTQTIQMQYSTYSAISGSAYRTPDESNNERNISSLQSKFPGQSFLSDDHQYGLFHSPEESSCNGDAVGDGDTFGTGIITRPRQPHSVPIGNNMGSQGSAPRRLRLQKELKIGSFACIKSRDFSQGEEKIESKPAWAKAEEAEKEHAIAKKAKAQSISPKPKEPRLLSSALKSPPAFSWFSSPIHTRRVLLVLGLSVAFLGIWICL